MPTDEAQRTVHIHRTLAAVEPRWRALWPQGAGDAFQSFDWFAAWFEEVGAREGWKPCVAELRGADGRPLFIAPLGTRREGLLRVLSFLGGELTDYRAPLVDAAFARTLDTAGAQRLWQAVLARLPAVDLVRLRRMPAALGGIANPLALLPDARPTEQAHAACLPGSFAAFCAARPARLFADTRRQWRRLAEHGAVQAVLRVPPAQQPAVMAALAAQKSQRWRDTGSADLFARPGYLAFYERLARQQALQGGIEAVVSALTIDGQTIATHWGLRSTRRFYWILPAYDAAWARFSPGRLLMEAALRQAIDEGLEVFDLTVGDEAYKRDWADAHVPLFALATARSPWGRLALAASGLRARARAVPALRAAVRRVRGLLRRG